MTISSAKILSVNVGKPKEFEHKGRTAKSAIWKTPVIDRVMAKGVNFEGDDQADRVAHGGYHKAIYAYAIEDMQWWGMEIGKTIVFGEFGENITTQGIDVNDALVGERWKIGSTLLEVSEPRIPCWRLSVRMNDKTFPSKFTLALRPGTYLRIIEAGDIGAGDEIIVTDKPDHDLSIRDVFRIYTRDHHEAERMINIEKLSDDWKSWAKNKLAT